MKLQLLPPAIFVTLFGTLLPAAFADDIVESGVPDVCINLSSGRTMPCGTRQHHGDDKPSSEDAAQCVGSGTRGIAACPSVHSSQNEIVESGVPGTCIRLSSGRTMVCPTAIPTAAFDANGSTISQPATASPAWPAREIAGPPRKRAPQTPPPTLSLAQPGVGPQDQNCVFASKPPTNGCPGSIDTAPAQQASATGSAGPVLPLDAVPPIPRPRPALRPLKIAPKFRHAMNQRALGAGRYAPVSRDVMFVYPSGRRRAYVPVWY
jgi:hypothetical protein